MNNEQKYKTPEERKLMFDIFCNTRLCEFCQCNADVIKKTESERNTKCKPKWLALEAEEKKPLPCSTVCVVETVFTKNGEPIATWNRSVKGKTQNASTSFDPNP